MKENVKAFIKYVYDHPSVQKKLEEAGKNCSDGQSREDIFRSVFLPVAQEAGFSISYEDVESAIQSMHKTADIKPLDMDEMSQVAGGGDGATVGGGLGGIVGCNLVGAGLGGTAGSGFPAAGVDFLGCGTFHQQIISLRMAHQYLADQVVISVGDCFSPENGSPGGHFFRGIQVPDFHSCNPPFTKSGPGKSPGRKLSDSPVTGQIEKSAGFLAIFPIIHHGIHHGIALLSCKM